MAVTHEQLKEKVSCPDNILVIWPSVYGTTKKC